MRIRKRKVPLPLSLLSPVPISDPYLFSRSQVVTADATQHPSQPLDHSILTSANNSALDLRRLIVADTTAPAPAAVKEDELLTLVFEEERGKQENNDVSGGISLGAKMVAPPPDESGFSLLSSQAYRVVPLKKRPRGSLLDHVVEEKKVVSSKMNEKLFSRGGKNEQQNVHFLNPNPNPNPNQTVISISTDTDNIGASLGGAKKGNKRRGNTIMEGSRCSRVNGRGWRCCQPTLVGYSLCEHHLGKGRLRSMTGVRGRPSIPKGTPPLPPPPPPPDKVAEKEDTIANEVKKPVTMSSVGKRVKLGVVKARSLSSLLGQTTNPTIFHNGVPTEALEINLNQVNNHDM